MGNIRSYCYIKLTKGDKMQISSSMTSTNAAVNSNSIKTNFTEKISKEEAASIRNTIDQYSKDLFVKSVNVQGSLTSQNVDFQEAYDDFQTFLSDIGYEGKNIGDLSQEEATDLVSEDGFFGIDQTSNRIADFVINGAAGDEEKLRSGRAGIIQGMEDAEAMWGSELPDISQKTMDAALEKIDKTMAELGYSILDQEA